MTDGIASRRIGGVGGSIGADDSRESGHDGGGEEAHLELCFFSQEFWKRVVGGNERLELELLLEQLLRSIGC